MAARGSVRGAGTARAKAVRLGSKRGALACGSPRTEKPPAGKPRDRQYVATRGTQRGSRWKPAVQFAPAWAATVPAEAGYALLGEMAAGGTHSSGSDPPKERRALLSRGTSEACQAVPAAAVEQVRIGAKLPQGAPVIGPWPVGRPASAGPTQKSATSPGFAGA